jgi:hypothetical protein
MSGNQLSWENFRDPLIKGERCGMGQGRVDCDVTVT